MLRYILRKINKNGVNYAEYVFSIPKIKIVAKERLSFPLNEERRQC